MLPPHSFVILTAQTPSPTRFFSATPLACWLACCCFVHHLNLMHLLWSSSKVPPTALLLLYLNTTITTNSLVSQLVRSKTIYSCIFVLQPQLLSFLLTNLRKSLIPFGNTNFPAKSNQTVGPSRSNISADYAQLRKLCRLLVHYFPQASVGYYPP